MNDILTTKEAAEVLKVTTGTMKRYIYNKYLPAVKIGKGFRIRRTDLDALLATGTPAKQHKS